MDQPLAKSPSKTYRTADDFKGGVYI